MRSRGPLQGVQVLLPVWGPHYIRQCLDLCIPSLLAPGNLPAVAASAPTTFILMTRERDMPGIRCHPAWLALAAVCDARLQGLDSLLSQAASFVLTLAYARTVRAAAAAALHTGFVFLVADYIVADGALRHVVGRLQSGADAVQAGNFQMSPAGKEALVALARRPDKVALARRPDDVALAVPPRALVRLALDWLHPATLACMPQEAVAHDARANRVFWRVGAGTLLGRFYLMHMVAIRPETIDVTIAAPCDYSFVPAFCPSGRIETITDSDDYFVVEMQPATAASGTGSLDPASLAGSLRAWVTAQHRRNATQPVVYHANQIDPDLAGAGLVEAIARSDRFVAETERLLGATAHPHRHHPYWTGALDHHQATALHPADRGGLEAVLGPGSVPETAGALRQRLLGRMPLPRPWHPHWADLRAVVSHLTALAPGRCVLIVSTEPGRVRAHLLAVAAAAGAQDVAHLEPEDVEAAASRGDGAGWLQRFDAALVIVRPSGAIAPSRLAGVIAEYLADDARIVLAMADLSDANAGTIDIADLAAVAERLAAGLHRVETVPAPRWRIASQAAMMRHARAAMDRGTMPARLRHMVAGTVCAGLSLAANCVCLRRTAASGGQRSCSTALLHLARAPRPSPGNLTPRAPAVAVAAADTWTA